VDLHYDSTKRCHTRLDLAVDCWSFAYTDFHVAFFVFAEAWPRLDLSLRKGKGRNVFLTIHPGKVDTTSKTKLLAANRRFAIDPGG